MTQYGFLFDANNCIGCKTCQVACKDSHRLPLGVNIRKVRSFTTGAFPEVGMYHISMACNHCAKPSCVDACPTGAMTKDPETGLVLRDEEVCVGCGACAKACPYDAIDLDYTAGKSVKCDGCAELRALGERPSCEAACPMRVIWFGDLDELKAKYGDKDYVRDCAVLPDSSQTEPALAMVVKPIMLDENYDEVFN